MQSGVRFFGQFLVATGVVDQASLDQALTQQAAVNVPLGALALSRGLLSERQVLAIHTEQRRTDKKFGELAVMLGFLRRAQVDELLRDQAEAHLLVGEALVQQGRIGREALDAAFADYKREQAGFEAELKRAIQQTATPSLVLAAADVTARMLLRMGKLPAKLAGVEQGGGLPPLDHVYVQPVDGDRPFTYLLALASRDVLSCARFMLEPLKSGELPTTVGPLALDVTKELVLAVVGQVCGRLAGEGWRLTPGLPEVAEAPPALSGGHVVIDLVLPHGRAAVAVQPRS
jgi:hypothetical protein